MDAQPLVSCIMPTYNRRAFVPRAIEYFLRQDYHDRELLILDDGEESVEDLVPVHPHIRYTRQARRQSVGTKRNAACEAAHGEIIVHWDDDDWAASWRLSYQVRELLESGADLCGLDRVLFVDTNTTRAWEYVHSKGGQPWVYGATLCYRKRFWQHNPFPDISVGEDSRFVWNARGARVLALQENTFYVGVVHGDNTSPKQVQGLRWQPRPIQMIQALMGSPGGASVSGDAVVAGTASHRAHRPPVLVSAAYGIGDILRVTPLIRVLHRIGYDVDVLLAPDYPETIELLRGAQEIRRLLYYPQFRRNRGAQRLPELEGEPYELATFTTWSEPLSRWIKSKVKHVFPQGEWLSLGDIVCIEKITRALGWQQPLPEPFAMASNRKFVVAPGTVALHPGCKPDWPWKKWHGFDELARMLPAVVVVGTDSDLDNRHTYFRRSFEWPDHARNFVGQLSLPDTAALLKQCAALVSVDSGLMHLGVALGVPTFGIFGLTSPQREMIPSRFMFPVTKDLSCEPACRQKPWGRRDCERHLECLKTLTAEEVATPILNKISSVRDKPLSSQKDDAMDTISLNYYGYVFDASGYGQAARAYIHALYRAGIKVSVVDMGSQPRQVQDDVVASLVGQDQKADFNLFHGIPPQWAHLAYSLRNVIAMTVWETDTMPQRWRNPLKHAIDIWLPCTFNVDVFGRDLGKQPFRLPHTIPATGLNGVPSFPHELANLGTRDDDFVFYSIFEWQDRKNPRGTIEAFLRAFPEEGPPVLVLKTNPGALAVAEHTLDAVRTTIRSRGRVLLACEAWTDAQLDALHHRGDCYVSLHKGEGWGYPLFEAACRGNPIVATGFSGPVDYLDPERHWLVRHSRASVQQNYIYYHPSMHWVEPDLAHAAEGMRWTYEQRDQVRARAQEATIALKSTFSTETVGAAAKSRLLNLLRHTNLAKWNMVHRRERVKHASPTLPIPGGWYDADYFEHGLKSNWNQGYTWQLFQGLFRETADYLLEMFPEASTFLDMGCAKGFLVAALREKGKEAFGFDHSPWAIQHAVPAARDYLQLADAGSAHYERTFDIVTAFSVFESLTESQIDSALSQLRRWTRQGFLAFIPTLKEDSEVKTAFEDLDLSHVTLRTRSWWHSRFLEAGWRQDPLHRVVEWRCRSHSLPTRMQWEIYVYAPGETQA